MRTDLSILKRSHISVKKIDPIGSDPLDQLSYHKTHLASITTYFQNTHEQLELLLLINALKLNCFCHRT